MQQLREEFLAGKQPKTCRRCWAEEASGKTSKRLNHMQVKQPMIVPLLNFTTLEPKNFLYLDLKLGSICNLKCRICGPAVSSKWAQESLMQIPYEQRKTHPNKIYLIEGEWPRTSQTFWPEVYKLIPKIKFLDFTGGEPFLIKEHFDLLKHSVEQGTSKYQHLFYNTNGTIFPEGAEELWKNFKRVEIAFSVDALGEQFELERSGAKWEEVNANIQKFRELRSRLPHIELQVSATVSIQNVYYLPEMCDWVSSQTFDHVYFNMLHDPWHMCISKMTVAAIDDQILLVQQLAQFSDGTVHYRRGHHQPPQREAVATSGEHQAQSPCLQGQRAGGDRFAGWSYRHHVQRHGRTAGPCQGQQDQVADSHREGAQATAPRARAAARSGSAARSAGRVHHCGPGADEIGRAHV